jgi:hypothetical protein
MLLGEAMGGYPFSGDIGSLLSLGDLIFSGLLFSLTGILSFVFLIKIAGCLLESFIKSYLHMKNSSSDSKLLIKDSNKQPAILIRKTKLRIPVKENKSPEKIRSPRDNKEPMSPEKG